MNVIRAKPPNYAEIVAAFPVAATRRGVIFAYGKTIYNPDGGPISKELMAHEAVHGARQAVDVAGWWRRYIADPAFRLDEEILAHRAEYQEICKRPDIDRPCMGFRSARKFYLAEIAKRLASPLYGCTISIADAKQIIAATPIRDTRTPRTSGPAVIT